MKTLLTGISSILFSLTCLLPLTALAQNPVKFTDDSPGKIAASIVEAINANDPKVHEAFVATRVSPGSLKNTPASEWLALIRRLHDQSKGIDVMELKPEGPRVLGVVVRSRQGNHWAKLVLISSGENAEQLSDIFVLPALDPAVAAKAQFPKSKVSESEAVRLISEQSQLRSSIDSFSGVVFVAKGDRVLFNKAYGLADQSFAIPNNVTTKFHLGSMDKMFTGVAIAQLVQAGKLSFNDTLAKVLPDFPNKQMAEKITIHQLLTHTAGTGDFITNPAFRAHRESYRHLADYLPVVADEKLQFEPGTRWSYSNSGYVILGLVIEKLSGQSYFDFVRDHIFKPTGMNETGYYELNEVVPNRAVGYLRDASEDSFSIMPRRSNVMFIPLKGNSAGGGYSTAADLFKFARALRGNKLLTPEMTEFVTAGKVSMVGVPRPGKYSYGFDETTVSGKDLRGMTGGGPSSGVNSSLEMLWGSDYTVIVVGNYDAPAAESLNYDICEFLALQ